MTCGIKEKSEIKPLHFILLLSVATFLMSNGFYFKILENYITATKDYVALMGAVFVLTLCFYIWFKKHDKVLVAMNSKYGKLIITFFVLLIIPTAVIGGIVDNRQDIIRPCLVVIRVYIGLLFFFWLYVYCSTDKLFLLLHKFVFVFGLVWIALCILFYVAPDLVSSVIIRSGDELSLRFDRFRFVPPVIPRNAIMYTAFYSFVRFATRKGPKKLHWLSLYLLGLFSFLFVLMVRRNTIILIIVPVIYSFFQLNITKKIVVTYIILNLAILPAIFSSNIYEDVALTFNSITSEYESTDKTSVNIRASAFNYYYPELEKSWFVGYGYYGSDKVPRNHRLAYGHSLGFNEVDLGIFMALLMYGIPGVLWTLTCYFHSFKDLLDVSKNLPIEFLYIRNTILMMFSWLIIALHYFVWGYSQAFWWGIIFFMVSYISDYKKRKPQSET